jgi:hypothetical protein
VGFDRRRVGEMERKLWYASNLVDAIREFDLPGEVHVDEMHNNLSVSRDSSPTRKRVVLLCK